ncbi:MAG: hypothetical protein V4850_08640 [Myxococcota bacterium]
MNVRELLERTYRNLRVYVYTTQGHVHVGRVGTIEDDVVELIAPDGVSRAHVRLTDISMLRPYDARSAGVS